MGDKFFAYTILYVDLDILLGTFVWPGLVYKLPYITQSQPIIT